MASPTNAGERRAAEMLAFSPEEIAANSAQENMLHGGNLAQIEAGIRSATDPTIRAVLAAERASLLGGGQGVPTLQSEQQFPMQRAGIGPGTGGQGLRMPGGGVAPSQPSPARQPMQAPTTNPRIQQLEAQRDQYQRELDQLLGGLSAGKDRAAQGVETAISQPMPERKQLQPLPQYHAQPYSQQDALNFGAIATAFAALAGLRTRQPLTSALIAAGSAMTGYSEGRFAQTRQDLDVYRTQFNAALDANRQQLAEYQSIINDRTLTRAEKVAMWQVASARWGDEATKGLLNLGQYDRAIQNLYTQLGSHSKLEQQSTQFYDNLDNKLQVAGMRPGARGEVPGMESAIPPEHAHLRGEAYLATLPTGVRNSVKAIAEGRASLNSLSIRQGARERFIQMVTQYDPKFDATRFPGNQAFAQVVGRRGAQLSLAGQEAIGLAEAALKEYQNVWRSDFMPLNEVVARVAQGGGSPDERRVSSRINSLVNVYARAINPVGPATVSDKEHAREILTRADSPEAFRAAVETLIDEIKIAERTFAEVQTRGASGASELVGGGTDKPSGLSPEKEQRYQELLRKRNAAQ